MKRSRSALTISVTPRAVKTRLKLWSEWPDNAGGSSNPLRRQKGNADWITTRCATGRAGMAHHAVHAGPCSVNCAASAWRKKLPTRKCGSAYPSCVICSPRCYGAGGTALNTCCMCPSGEDDTNSTPCTATIESADLLCPHSIYNCSTRSGGKDRIRGLGDFVVRVRLPTRSLMMNWHSMVLSGPEAAKLRFERHNLARWAFS